MDSHETVIILKAMAFGDNFFFKIWQLDCRR